jgi:2-polyprenyl-6-methoxyphenol hydroxylase-like FAD-dependent oxidoreductase
MRIDALIVGAGPVGLTMAAELKRYGLRVRIVDKAAERTDKSKALVIWSRTLELMDRMGCTASFVDAGLKCIAANISAGDEEIAHIPLDGVDSAYPFALMLPQSETERLLEEYLGTLGVKPERGVEVTGFEVGVDDVVSTLRLADGSEETVESAWLIGCDGAHSIVRHKLGMTFEGDTLNSDWILADVHLKGVPRPGEVSVVWHAEGILVFFPIREERYRMIANVGAGSKAAAGAEQTVSVTNGPTLEEVQAVIDQRGPGGIVASQPIWLAGFHINERKVKEYRAGRVFLAGDAAHIHSPAGGQGMNTGMQDACNLPWKLALVERGVCTASLLDSYSPERSAVGEAVLKGAGRLTAAAVLSGEVKQSIRNHIASVLLGFSPVRKAAADELTELSIGYPKSPLNGHNDPVHGGPAAGERAPIRAGETAVGTGSQPRFVLFGDGEDGAAANALIARYPELVEQTIRPGFHEGGIWLVRPDGYVAVAVRRGGLEHIAAYLDGLVN